MPGVILASCAFTYGIRGGDYEGSWSQFPYNALPFFLWLLFYVAGLALAEAGARGWVWRPAGWLALAATSAVASVAEAFHWMPGAIDLATSQLKITSIITSLLICALMVAMARTFGEQGALAKALAWLGGEVSTSTYPTCLF